MMFKSQLVVALVAISVAAVRAGEFEILVETGGDTGLEPKDAPFACRIESRSCKSVSHYTEVSYDHGIQLTPCYQPHTIKNLYNRLTPFGHRGMFVDTVYVSCPAPQVSNVHKSDNDKALEKACDFAAKFNTLEVKDVRQIIEDGINEHTDCDPRVECYKIEDVDEQCFPKEKEEKEKKEKKEE